MKRTLRRASAVAVVAVLGIGGAACSDEDGDGATTDEEVGELDDGLDDAGDQLETEVDEGQNEAGDDSGE